MASRRWIAACLVGTGAAVLVANCSDSVGPCTAACQLPPDTGLVVSHPVPQPIAPSRSRTMSPTGGGDLVYISLLPGTVPGAARLVIQNPSTQFALTASMTAGGIDPVPVPAVPGDTLLLVVTDSSGRSVWAYMARVKPSNPPVVVRTEPARKKTDVPLNASIAVVFSQPMNGGSITSQTVTLLGNGQPVSVRVALAPDGLRALVAPNAGSLAPQTSYRLIVAAGVTDVSGYSLAQSETDFTTGSSFSYGLSVTVSPAAATIPVGSVLQLTATVRDGAGNAIGPSFRGVQWSASNATVAVTPSGLVSALDSGRAIVSAAADSVFGGGTAVIDVVPAGLLFVGGAWDWTETIVDPQSNQTCSDTGTYVFAQTGSTFTGTSQQVGVCRTPTGPPIDNTHIDPVTNGRAGSSSGRNNISFVVSGCTYAATVNGALDQLSGTVSCGTTATGTWLAHRPRPLASVAVLPSPLPSMVNGDTARVRAALRDGAGNRVFARAVTWTSDVPAVATVSGVTDSAVLIATGPGTTSIKAAAEGQSGSSALTVTAAASIRVTTTTTGVDQDADGYAVSVDAGPATPVATNGVKTLTPFRAGNRSVALSGVADNCSVTSPNPTVVGVVVPETTDVAFTVNCTAAGALRVTTVSTGVDVPSGYLVFVDNGPGQVIAANGELVVSPLGARAHTVFLDTPTHCAVSEANPTTVQVTAGNTTDVPFHVSCAAIGRIAFYSINQGLVSMIADGSAATPIPVAGYQPAWSPNGARIAFMPLGSDCAGKPVSSVVCVMNADGSGVMGLPITTTLSPYGLSWSPDGTRIAFVGAGGLYAVNVDGSGDVPLTSGVGVSFPAWSPDGTKIAFTCAVQAGNNDICVVNADGTGLLQLTTDPADDHRPAWKPDGSKIAFATSRYGLDGNGNAVIAVMNPDGSGVTSIANGDAPAWSPDGGRISTLSYNNCDPEFGCDLWLMVMRADGSGRRFIGNAVYANDTPAWKP